MKTKLTAALSVVLLSTASLVATTQTMASELPVFEPGHPSLKAWLLGDVPFPTDNEPNTARVELGKMLFFDPRLSGDGNMTCASCHNPLFGWSDGLGTAKGFKSKVLGRASPTVINTAFNPIQMWDGRKKTLEDQATGPMLSSDEMNINMTDAVGFLKSTPGYVKEFNNAYPGEAISDKTIAKAIASFERTVISNNSPFDRWIKGDKKAMTAEQVKGFELFVNPNKGNCEVCHSGANFTDNGFHNVGLASFGNENPDVGRYAIKPIKSMQGAFKTPTLRDIDLTAPYFHDGSATTLDEAVQVMAQYQLGYELEEAEVADLVAFLKTLTGQLPK